MRDAIGVATQPMTSSLNVESRRAVDKDSLFGGVPPNEIGVARQSRRILVALKARAGAAILIAILALLALPPIAILLQTSLTEPNPDGSAGAFTWAYYVALITSPDLFVAGRNSLVFAIAATLVSLVLGATLAWIVERTNAPFKALAYLTAFVSMGMPYVLYVTAWIFLFGRVGPFNTLYQMTLGDGEILFNVYSMWGMVLIEGFLWSPLVFLMLGAAFRASNAEMEEAARMSGASVFDTVWHVSVKLARPALFAMALFAFIRNLEAFEVPVLIGTPSDIKLLTTAIYSSIMQVPPQYGHASAFSVVMLVVLSALLSFYGRLSRSAERFATVTGKGYRPRPFDLGGFRWFAGGIILVNFFIVLCLPFLALLWSSLMPFPRPISVAALRLLTVKNYVAILNSPSYPPLALNTLMTSAGVATAAIILTLLAGWFAARRRPGGAILDQLSTVPLIFPGVVLGVAMIEITLALPFPLYGTLWAIGLGLLIRYMPYGMRYTYAGVLQIHRELEDAAKASGASQFASLRNVVAPLLSPAIVSGWLFIFLIAAKELSVSVLLAGPRSKLMSVALFDMWWNGQGGEVAALGLVWMVPMVVCASLFYLSGRRQSVSVFGR